MIIIQHTYDFRGDHSADVRKVFNVPDDAPVSDLKKYIGIDSYGKSWIEITCNAFDEEDTDETET